MALVIDTGVIFAALNEDDPRHDACDALIAECREPLFIPDHVLVELDYWRRKFAQQEAWHTFCEDIANGGSLELLPA